MANTPDTAADTQMGLRERKKLAAMQRIQTTALDLFDAHGYDAVTIERIAEDADVSPSTVYRYFGTKERMVLWDEYDPVMFGALGEAEPGTPPLDAVRAAIDAAVPDMLPNDEPRIRRRLRYAFTVPAINAAVTQEFAEADQTLRNAFARQTGLDADDLELRVFVSSALAAFMTALRYWLDHEDEMNLADTIHRALDVLEHDLSP